MGLAGGWINHEKEAVGAILRKEDEIKVQLRRGTLTDYSFDMAQR